MKVVYMKYSQLFENILQLVDYIRMVPTCLLALTGI